MHVHIYWLFLVQGGQCQKLDCHKSSVLSIKKKNGTIVDSSEFNSIDDRFARPVTLQRSYEKIPKNGHQLYDCARGISGQLFDRNHMSVLAFGLHLGVEKIVLSELR